jgi:hypothetical protein
MRPTDDSQVHCKARVHLIQLAIDHDVNVMVGRVAASGDWVASASHKRGEHWSATSSDLLQAVLQLERLLICSQRLS